MVGQYDVISFGEKIDYVGDPDTEDNVDAASKRSSVQKQGGYTKSGGDLVSTIASSSA